MKVIGCALFCFLLLVARRARKGGLMLWAVVGVLCLPLLTVLPVLVVPSFAANTLSNAPQTRPVAPPATLPAESSAESFGRPGVAPDDPPFVVWVPGTVVPDLAPDVVLLPGAVLPGAQPGMVVPQVKLPDGTLSPGLVGPDGKVVPAVVDPEGNFVPGLVDSKGQITLGMVGPDKTVVPAVIGPEGTLIPAVLAPVVPGQSFSPADFLVREKDLQAGKEPAKPTAPNKQPEPKKNADLPKSPEPEKKLEPVKPEPVKPEPAKPEPRKPVAKGQPLRIPEEAKKTGDLSFLEGCWKGYRPEYRSKRMITERFCFDASGKGRRTIIDPTKTGMCNTATRALIDSGGVLKMESGAGYCLNGAKWNKSTMTCRGSGANTPCTWVFGPKDSQSYSISLVRD